VTGLTFLEFRSLTTPLLLLPLTFPLVLLTVFTFSALTFAFALEEDDDDFCCSSSSARFKRRETGFFRGEAISARLPAFSLEREDGFDLVRGDAEAMGEAGGG